MQKIYKIGDTIRWRGGFGQEPAQDAVIEDLEVTPEPRSKYGTPVREVNENLIRANRVLFSLTNGHWCYSDQIDLD